MGVRRKEGSDQELKIIDAVGFYMFFLWGWFVGGTD
jgi:hypothetical protein